jgi:hypothetical protein
MKKSFLFTLLLFLNTLYAQPALISWEVKEGNKGDDFYTKSIQLSNGNLAVIGNVTSPDGSKRYGLLSLIDFSTGKIIKKTAYWTKAAFAESVSLRSDLTFYTQYGDWPAGLSLSWILLVMSFVFMEKSRHSSKVKV